MSPERTFRELVGETMGEASVTLWDETPKGVFNSEWAMELTNRIVLAHIKIVADLTKLSPKEIETILSFPRPG